GPVFGTGTKDTGYEAVGLEMVREAVRGAEGRPVVAIGGITLDNARSVIEAGAAPVAVISDLLQGGDPEARVAAFVKALAWRRTSSVCDLRPRDLAGLDVVFATGVLEVVDRDALDRDDDESQTEKVLRSEE